MSTVIPVFVDDLFFMSKLSAVASSTGVRLVPCRTPAECPEGVVRIIIDLNAQGFDPVETIRQVRGKGQIVAFVAHVDTALRAAAIAAGADEVLPRSAFVARLPEFLRD